jgi:small subunit ribosomal protein S6
MDGFGWDGGQPVPLARCPFGAAPPAADSPQPPESEGGRILSASNAQETSLRQYEIMVILDPDLDERTVAPSLDTYLNVVRQAGGTVDNVDVWGKRRLAYEINKKSEGIYAVIDLTAEPAAVKELDRQFSLNESVVRTKVIRPGAN